MSEIEFTDELEQQWIKALESGKYIQGKRNLKLDGKYCCIGVLCEITGKDIPEGDICPESELEKKEVRLLYSIVRDLIGSETLDKLIDFNDTGESFKEIAQRIRDKNFKKLDEE